MIPERREPKGWRMDNTAETSRIRVAIVDDSEDVRYLLATVMEVDGRFQIVGEADGANDALDMVAETRPHLVLVDLQLEGLDGTWLVRELRRRRETAVLAVVTASTHAEEHDAALAAGADAVHNKMSMTSTMMDDLASLIAARVPAA